MQIILREHVENLGKRGTVVSVADGFARNFLIPKGLAYKFTDGIHRQVEIESRRKVERETRERVAAEQVGERVKKFDPLKFVRKAGESGVLFGSVTNVDIAEALGRHGITIDRRTIRLGEPIKKLGAHRVSIHLHHEVDVELGIEVEAEQVETAPSEPQVEETNETNETKEADDVDEAEPPTE